MVLQDPQPDGSHAPDVATRSHSVSGDPVGAALVAYLVTARCEPTGLRDTPPMKLYFAGPLFTTSERTWNAEVVAALREAGHEVFLPQEKEPGKDAAGIFATDVSGIDWADGLVAIVDGPDPDSGTSWEVGYVFRSGKPIVLVRTDVRDLAGEAGRYNPMLAESATIRLDLPAASTTDVVTAILEALSTLERDPVRGQR